MSEKEKEKATNSNKVATDDFSFRKHVRNEKDIDLNPWRSEFKFASLEAKYILYRTRSITKSTDYYLNFAGLVYFLFELVFLINFNDTFLSRVPALLAIIVLAFNLGRWMYMIRITSKAEIHKVSEEVMDKKLQNFELEVLFTFIIVASIDFFITLAQTLNNYSGNWYLYFASGCKLFMYQIIFGAILAPRFAIFVRCSVMMIIVHVSSYLWNGYSVTSNFDSAPLVELLGDLYLNEILAFTLAGSVNLLMNKQARRGFFFMLKLLDLENISASDNNDSNIDNNNLSSLLRNFLNGEDKPQLPNWIHDFNEIQLFEEIGSGNNGSVYRASWKNNIVAIKIVLTDFEKHPGEISRISNNLKAHINMRHPNIVHLLSCCISKSQIGFIYPFYENNNLQHFLSIKNDLDLNMKLDLAIGIAKGIKYLHHENIVHGDMKSLNCLVDKDLNIGICDFEITKSLPKKKSKIKKGKHHSSKDKNEISKSGRIALVGVVGGGGDGSNSVGSGSSYSRESKINLAAGIHSSKNLISDGSSSSAPLSLPWLSPELLTHRDGNTILSMMNDVYAFGIILWEIITQKIPYADIGYHSIRLFVMDGGRPSLEGYNIPEQLRDLYSDCIDKNTEKRPNIQSILNKLEIIKINNSNDSNKKKILNLEDISTKINPKFQTVNDIEKEAINMKVNIIKMEELKNLELFKTGSQGSIYIGQYNNKQVAVKRFQSYKQSFRREVFILSKLQHPNILKLIGYSFDPDMLMIVTNVAERGDLISSMILDDGHDENYLDWSMRLKLSVDIAAGLKYLHSQNPIIVHRDIKPDNCLVHENWTAVLGDFGFSAYLQYGVLNSSYGTPLYAAPEILLNTEYDESVDVYSFGVLLNFVVTLIRPYDDIPGDSVWLLKSINCGALRPTLYSDVRFKNLSKASAIKVPSHGEYNERITASKSADVNSSEFIPLLSSELSSECISEWTLVSLSRLSQMCWSQKKEDRPTMTQVHNVLQKILALAQERSVNIQCVLASLSNTQIQIEALLYIYNYKLLYFLFLTNRLILQDPNEWINQNMIKK